jgi:hypothetical protein
MWHKCCLEKAPTTPPLLSHACGHVQSPAHITACRIKSTRLPRL